MRVHVELCWAGGERFKFRLTLPYGRWCHVLGDRWTRQLATEALDILERVYGLDRRNIRFNHK